MPFTLAHPSAVVFLKSKYLNICGLILGSMAPDFIYFILFNPSSNIGHTLIGFLLLNLPICFILNYLIDNYIKDAFIINLPFELPKYYCYLISSKNNINSIKKAIVFIYSCIIGMITHVFWDAFTHSTGYFVEHISILRYEIEVLGFSAPIYKIIQHSSTILGFTIILVYLYSIRRISNKSLESNKYKYHITAIGIQVIVIGFSYLCFEKFGIGRFVVTFINGLVIGYLVSSILYKYKHSYKNKIKF